MRDAGLGAFTGGGAEIFDAGVRDEICRGKESAEEWLDVHRTWHQMGGRSTAPCFTVTSKRSRSASIICACCANCRMRRGGFTGFVPFAFEPQTAVLAHIKRASAFDQLRNLAVSRIYLDNFDHLTAYWVSMGLPLAQLSLSYGVDDLHGTIMEEKIFHMAGAKRRRNKPSRTLENVIREAGRDPDAARQLLSSSRRRRRRSAPTKRREPELACA